MSGRVGVASLAVRARRAVTATGPWPAARTLQCAVATVLAVLAAGWAVTAEPPLGGLLGAPALAGLAALAVALLAGRLRLLGAALVLLAVAVGLAVAAVSPSAPTVAGLGTALAGMFELSRWSIERRVDPVVEDATERRRWWQLILVLGLGWLVGVGAVAVAAGRLPLAVWQVMIAALAVVVVAGVVALAARSHA